MYVLWLGEALQRHEWDIPPDNTLQQIDSAWMLVMQVFKHMDEQ